MMTRALLIALCCAFATAGTPLSAIGDDNECALYLSGPGRTSAYDYSLNLLKGNFGYEGQHTCITYDAVNQAYLEARNRILVAQPKGDWKAEDFASVGELLLDISINLARMYGLTYEEIEKGLPLIDTSRTLIREVCPPIFSHVECRAGKYRRYDGLCTNLQHPTWGATMAPFQRLIGPLFSDGINAPRISHTGHDLPLSRVVSRTMHPDDGFHDHAGTVMVIAWGQFMDHDYTLTGTPLDPVNRNDPEECCKRPPHLKHPYCNEIKIPDDDYFYRLFGVKCIDFVRAFPSPRPGCRLGSRVPFNTLTGVLDGNTVYGVTEKFARKLRTGYGGLLRMNPVFKDYGLKDLLPLKLDIPDEGCTRPDKNMYCFEAGEIRVNEQLVLTVMHTLMAREHNRVARGLAEVNPHWDDETLFQEARRINIGEIQYITYNEFLPILLGKDVMEKFGLVLEKEGYWDGYDPEVNPDVIDSFAAAAYRFGHSLLPTAVERWSKAHKFIASKRLSDLIRRPYDLYRAGVLDEYVMGLMNQVAQAMDDSITQEVTNHLFKKVGSRFGMDLVSFNMQRGREFGLPGYMEFRKFCGLSGANSFQDLFGSMPNDTVHRYETIFEHPIDVDLWSGGVSERPLPGSMLGPTFACIIATQFSYSRRGDRFWFELPNQPSSFTPEQLKEIRKARLARVICDNTDIIDTVQLYPMVLPDHELNPRVPCRSGIIPSIDFTKWAEPAPFHGSAKQFMTEAYVSTANLNASKTEVHINTVTTDTRQNTSFDESIRTNLDIKQTPDGDITQKTVVAPNNTINNNTNPQGCVQGSSVNGTNKCDSIQIGNKMNANDTILKYVYKNNEKPNITQKGAGHPKNSLKRKKRSKNSEISSKDNKAYESKRAPLLIDYETSHRPRYADLTSSLLEHTTSNVIRNSNYASSHEPRYKEKIEPQQDRTTGNVIKNANLADFNIETLHDKTTHSKKNNENRKQNVDIEFIDVKHPQQHGKKIEEDNEKYPYPNNRRLYHEREESLERENYRGDKKDSRNDYNNENQSSADNKKIHEKDPNSYRKEIVHQPKTHTAPSSLESFESNEKDKTQNKKRTYSDESQESYERDRTDYNRNNKLTYPKPIISSSVSEERDDKYARNKDSTESNESGNTERNNFAKSREYSQESIEKETGSIKPSPKLYSDKYGTENKLLRHEDDARKLGQSNENSNESYEKVPKLKEPLQTRKNEDNEYINKNKPTIQEVDLEDFSYEKIQINDKGQVVPTNESNEKYDSIPSKEITTSTPTPKTSSEESHEKLTSTKSIDTPSNVGSNEDSQDLIKVNIGEIRPVVEINPESNSDEFTESVNSKEPLNETLNTKHESLESLLGVKDLHNNEQSAKVHDDKEEEKGDVKQQFERIPLTYKHDEIKPKQNNENVQPEKSSNIDNEERSENEGTLDTLLTKDPPQYDENLNFKFDDVTVTLPEIKLPDDILAYTYENSPYQKHKKQKNTGPKFYHYSNEHNDEENEKKPSNDDEEDEDDGYDSYYGNYKDKDDYKKKTQDDEDEDEEHEEEDNVDLYEKFVRERFGKQGTFAQRSENLRDPRPVEDNPHLQERIQKILKKTKDVQKQAEKSGDPNAGYMWTLEYGQNL